jgi:hypothetical protein
MAKHNGGRAHIHAGFLAGWPIAVLAVTAGVFQQVAHHPAQRFGSRNSVGKKTTREHRRGRVVPVSALRPHQPSPA